MAGPVTVKHNRGEVTLDRPAQRVVVLEWTFTEDMIALGVQPVDNAGYKQYVTPEVALDSSMTDVGTRDVFGAALKNNSVWNGLNFVKEKRIYALDSKTWTLAVPFHRKRWLTRLLRRLHNELGSSIQSGLELA